MKSNVAKILLLLMGSLFFVINAGHTYAASVGERLSEPENGWVRFDDKHPNIQRSNGKFGYTPSSLPDQAYEGGYYYSNDKDAVISFSFTGSKIRLLAPTYIHQSNDIQVRIDGQSVGNYSAYAKTVTHRAIVFEKLDLSSGKHTIEIKNNVAGKELEIDAVDLESGNEVLDSNSPFNLTASSGDSQVSLKWDSVEKAESYMVYYGTQPGDYTESLTVSADAYKNYTISGLINGTTYYFKVTSKVDMTESSGSKEAKATPIKTTIPIEENTDKGNRALLTVIFVNGIQKEYDLSISELSKFTAWYDAKDSGTGPSRFVIDKQSNNKGPFNKRTDSIIFNNILLFEIDEYTLS